MKYLISLLFLWINMNGNLYAQKYMYLYDNDLYVNIRSEASRNSEVIDTLYNLQIVEVCDKKGDWNYIVSPKDRTYGFVHNSRLKSLPEYVLHKLDSIYAESIVSGCFIAGTDCPEIIVYLDTDIFRIKENFIKEYDSKPFKSYEADCSVLNLKTGQILQERYLMYPVKEILLYPDRIIFNDYTSTSSYYCNSKGKLCRGVIPFLDYNKASRELTNEELDIVFDIARRAVAEGKKHESGYPERGISKIIQRVNDYDYLDKLRLAYISGNKEAREYYPYLLQNYPLDGEGTHAIEYYFADLWTFDNRGEIELE